MSDRSAAAAGKNGKADDAKPKDRIKDNGTDGPQKSPKKRRKVNHGTRSPFVPKVDSATAPGAHCRPSGWSQADPGRPRAVPPFFLLALPDF